MRLWALMLILQALALRPVWAWYVARLTDNSGDEYGLLALGTALLLLWCRPGPVRGRPPAAAPVALLLLYAALCRFVPAEVRAALAFVSVAATLSGMRRRPAPDLAMVGLFLLSLPLIPSVQFYAGYPLRVLVASGASPILRLGGFDVARQGACLAWGDMLISIDAPCSGVRMLWAGGYLLCTLAVLYRVGPWRTVVAGAVTVVLVVAANVLRSCALFYLEADVILLPAAAHEGTGIVVFVFLAAAIVLVVRHLRPECAGAGVEEGGPGAAPWRTGWLCAFSAAAFVAGLLPLLPSADEHRTPDDSFPGWPAEWEGRTLTPLPLSEREERFAARFPGRTARFTDGYCEIVMRWVRAPTRRLHPAADCLRSYGARIKALPLHVDGQGGAWGAFEVARDGRRLRLHEQFRDGSGRTWSDVSSWYWAAVLGRTTGPWWVLVVVQPAD